MWSNECCGFMSVGSSPCWLAGLLALQEGEAGHVMLQRFDPETTGVLVVERVLSNWAGQVLLSPALRRAQTAAL